MKRRRRRLVQCTLPQASAPLSQWYREAYGRRLLRETEAALGAWIARAVGYYALDVRAFESHARWLDASLVQSHFALSPVRQEDSRVVGDLLRLPFEANSLDLVVAHHVLEFCADPHEFLREVDRTLIPEGRVIVVGFNPFGAPGLLKWFQSRAVAPWGGHFYPAPRVREWFTVLGFDVEKTRYFAFPFASPPPASSSSASSSASSPPAPPPAPPRASSGRVSRPSWVRLLPFCGALFALLAVKRVSRMVTVGESWAPKKVLGAKEIQPTARLPLA